MAARTPSSRVNHALRRLTRDRWISGDDMLDLCRRLSKIASPSGWANVANAAMPGECACIGMIYGRPPAYLWNPNYDAYVRALHGKKTLENASIELTILALKLKDERSWQ